MATKTTGYVVVTFRVHEEDGQYVATCPELGVASCGDTIQEAFDAIEDAVSLYLETIEEEGERERILSERGLEVRRDISQNEAEEVVVRARPNEYVSAHVMPIGAEAA